MIVLINGYVVDRFLFALVVQLLKSVAFDFFCLDMMCYLSLEFVGYNQHFSIAV